MEIICRREQQKVNKQQTWRWKSKWMMNLIINYFIMEMCELSDETVEAEFSGFVEDDDEVLEVESHHHHHHHLFNVSVPLKVGRTAPMFVLSFFLHSILFAGSALDSFQCLRSLLIVSFHVFFSLPRPCCPTTSNSVMLLIQPSFLTTCPNQRS